MRKQQLVIRTVLRVVVFLGSWGQLAVAQSAFQPGYVIKSDGDSLRGEVDYRATDFNSQYCHFRAQSTTNVQEYEPRAIRAYGLSSGLRYEAAAIKIDTATRQYFLQVVEKGRAKLWLLIIPTSENQGLRERLFVQGQGAKAPTGLQFYAEVRQTVGGATVRNASGAYRGVLATALADCPAVQLAIARLAPSNKAVQDLIKRYNQACGESKAEASQAVSNPLPNNGHWIFGADLGIVVGGSFKMGYTRLIWPPSTLNNRGGGGGFTASFQQPRFSVRFPCAADCYSRASILGVMRTSRS